MKKYDCSKTLDYFHERERLCKTKLNCCICELGEEGGSCHVITGFSQKDIDNLQKWSDEHPEKTRAEAFLEMFPKLKKDDAGMLRLPCVKILIGEYPCCAMLGDKCWECWSQPYNGEFEKEEK